MRKLVGGISAILFFWFLFSAFDENKGEEPREPMPQLVPNEPCCFPMRNMDY